MAINTQRLYDIKAVKFGTTTTSNTFNVVFMECLYQTIIDINNFTGMSITPPTDTDTNIDMDEKYYVCVSDGIDFFLQDTNMFTANPIADAEGRYLRSKKMAQRMYLQSIDMNSKFGTLESESSTDSEGFAS